MEYQNQYEQEPQNQGLVYPIQTPEDIELQWQQSQQKEQQKQALLSNNCGIEENYYQITQEQYNDAYEDHIAKERTISRQCPLRIIFVVAFIIFCITQLACQCIFT